ncbi:MAG: aspartate ammonia-lyase [Myxococcales bacterium]|nr:aspartate ammonia-lyase [Myxococcales bacterium]
MARLKADLAGNAGVMFVAAELGRRGLIALPTMRNTEGVDLIASEPLGGKSVAIQLKSTQSRGKKWLVTKKNETLSAPGLYYVLVSLGLPGELPEFHMVPSAVVAKSIKRAHASWLATPGRGGRQRNDSNLRTFFDADSTFRDDWDALGLRITR